LTLLPFGLRVTKQSRSLVNLFGDLPPLVGHFKTVVLRFGLWFGFYSSQC